MSIYFCKCCGYDAKQKYNLAKHIRTIKHKRLLEKYLKNQFENQSNEDNDDEGIEGDTCTTANYMYDNEFLNTENHKNKFIGNPASSMINECAEVKPKPKIAEYPIEADCKKMLGEEFRCKYCDKVFKYKQGMYRHIKYTCKNQIEG